MSPTPHRGSQQAASISSMSSDSPSSLFPPYRTGEQSSHVQSNSWHAAQICGSQSANKSSSQVLARGIGDNSTHLDSKPRPTWRRCSRFFSNVLPGGWTLEYISCFISVLAFVSIIVVLHQYDQRKLPSWPLGITINTLIAFLTTISQSTFTFPVVQGLAQMKWAWFMGKSRPLGDFEAFDNASRGAWGSVLLLFSTKGRLSVLLAAILLVTSAVTSTITQAVITQDTRYVSNNQIATAYRMITDNTTADYGSSINQMAGYMISAMFTSVNSTYNFTDPQCATGNCQWPSFGSLAVCAETNDITDKLVVEETASQCCTNTATNRFEGWTWTETCTNCTQVGLSQNEHFWLAPQEYVSLNSSSDTLSDSTDPSWSRLYTFSNETFGYNALTAAQIIYLNTTDAAVSGAEPLNNTELFIKYARAVETLFYMCVETYNVTTTNGTTFTNVTSTTNNVTWYDQYGALAEGRYPTVIDNRTFTVDGFNYSFSEIGLDINQIIQSSVQGRYDFTSQLALYGMTPFSYALGTAMYRNQDINATTGTTRDALLLDTLDDVMNNIARGATNWLRSFFAAPVEGQNFVSDTFVVVRWPYLIFLGVQVFLSVVFLIWVMLDSRVRKVDILKDSGMATLFAISAEDKANFEARFDLLDEKSDERDELERLSKVTLVKCEPGQWNLQVVGSLD